MRICDLHSGTIKLTKAAKRLRDQWATTRGTWTDMNAIEFEQQHFLELTPQLALTLAAVQKLADILDRAGRDLTDGDRSI